MNRRQVLAAALLTTATPSWVSARQIPRSGVGPEGGPTASLPAPVLGTAWYPEQWPEDLWSADLAMMREAGLKVVRLGEFAWSRMEPRNGRFEFEWLDRAVAAAADHGLWIVLGTPTAAPPIWLTETHPEVRRMDENGRAQGHGGRRQFSVASATYRRYAVRIAAALGRRFGRNPAVVGWQIDNEIGLETFDEEAKTRWAAWLQTRYGTIDALNRRWTTAYWSQTYQRFDQIPLSLDPEQSPALLLDARRFFSWLWADYVGDQARVLRAHAGPRPFITTNSTLWNDHFDQYLVHDTLDLAAWDLYAPTGRPDWADTALHHAVVRGYKGRNFWVMETQPGFVNWGSTNRSLDPGETRQMAWQAVGRGADAVLYWQWRSALGGQEQYHGTLVGPDGQPTPVFTEVARTAREFDEAASVLAGTVPRAEVALIYDMDSRWALEQQRHVKAYDPVSVIKAWHRPLFDAGITVDVVPADADLSAYRLVLAPALNVTTAVVAARLADYVRQGGRLVLGPRGSVKDEDNALWPQRPPGPLADLFGVTVDGFYGLDEELAVSAPWPGNCRVWAETLNIVDPSVEILARYGSGAWTEGRAAIVQRTAGRGVAVYVGALLDAQGQSGLTGFLLAESGVSAAPMPVPPGVEVAARHGADGLLACVLLNHGATTAPIELPGGFRRVTGDMIDGSLAPGGVDLIVRDAVGDGGNAGHSPIPGLSTR